MPPPRRTSPSAGTARQRRGVAVSRSAPRQTQRERLIEAIVGLAGHYGYQSLSIAQISARAGVSSATFYEQFSDREECMLAAYTALTGQTLARMASSLSDGEWASAARPAFLELLESITGDPDAGRVMFVESLAAGPRLRTAQSRVLDGIERSAEDLLDSAPTDGVTLDIPGRALLGAVRYVVSNHLRAHAEDKLPALAEDMLAWMGSYAVPAVEGRWSTSPASLLEPAGARTIPTGAPAEPVAERERLPRGRHGLPPGAVARNQRARLLRATASVTMRKGYAASTVADIVAAAGVAKEAFYRHFRDKEQVFLEAQEGPSQEVLDAIVEAYFSADRWEDRIWLGLGRWLELVAANPVSSHLRLVECYAAGPAAVRRAERGTRSFSIFLEEGYRQQADSVRRPRSFSQAITGAIFEIVQHDVATGRTAELPRRLPQLTYLVTAPFLGPAAAIEAIAAKGR